MEFSFIAKSAIRGALKTTIFQILILFIDVVFAQKLTNATEKCSFRTERAFHALRRSQ